MAMPRQIPVDHAEVFPSGATLKGEVKPVADWNAAKREDGSRPQQMDKETGLPLWQVTVTDLDSEGSKSDAGVAVKIAAKYQPVPPSPVDVKVPGLGTIKLQFVQFVDLVAVPYVADQDSRPHLAWSYRASGFAEVSGQASAGDVKAAA